MQIFHVYDLFIMLDSSQIPVNLLLAYTAYLVGTASPGPSNLAIIATAMNSGRISALILASGIITGSLFWGFLAAFGLSTVLASYSGALVVMKIVGGFYLLWLAMKSGRSALSARSAMSVEMKSNQSDHVRTFLRGAAMHLTNPKAIFVWLSIVTLALPAKAKAGDALLVVIGCAVIGVAVFGGYAVVFSTPVARRIYPALRRGFEGMLAAIFSYAGIRLLLEGVRTA